MLVHPRERHARNAAAFLIPIPGPPRRIGVSVTGFMFMEIAMAAMNGARLASCKWCRDFFLTGAQTNRRKTEVLQGSVPPALEPGKINLTRATEHVGSQAGMDNARWRAAGSLDCRLCRPGWPPPYQDVRQEDGSGRVLCASQRRRRQGYSHRAKQERYRRRSR